MTDPRYEAAIIRPVATETEDWVSFFLPDRETSEKYKKKISVSQSESLEEMRREVDNGDKMNEDGGESSNVFRFSHIRDYDMDYQVGEMNELFLAFDDESKSAYYTPINARAVLKRRRVIKNNSNKSQSNNNDIAAIEISFRDLTGEESVERDSLRQQYGYIPPKENI